MHVAARGVLRRLSFTQPTSVLPGLAAPGSDIIEFYARMPVRGLHLAGQTTFPGYGVPSAMLFGVQAADALVRQLQAGGP